MPKRAKGANIVPADAAARVDIAQKCALIAVEIPNPPAKPKVVRATDIDTALEELDVNFKVQLRRLDGQSSKETIRIRSLEDFEEATIGRQSDVLREQILRMDFLRQFQDELRNNKVFREEIKAFLMSDKRAPFLEFLNGWTSQFKKPNSEFMNLLQS